MNGQKWIFWIFYFESFKKMNGKNWMIQKKWMNGWIKKKKKKMNHSKKKGENAWFKKNEWMAKKWMEENDFLNFWKKKLNHSKKWMGENAWFKKMNEWQKKMNGRKWFFFF